MAPLLHLGMIVVGVPYSVQELFTTQGGGSRYGPGHIAGDDNRRPIDEQEAAICRALGRRLAIVGLKLRETLPREDSRALQGSADLRSEVDLLAAGEAALERGSSVLCASPPKSYERS